LVELARDLDGMGAAEVGVTSQEQVSDGTQSPDAQRTSPVHTGGPATPIASVPAAKRLRVKAPASVETSSASEAPSLAHLTVEATVPKQRATARRSQPAAPESGLPQDRCTV
jgi:hypothetical protein